MIPHLIMETWETYGNMTANPVTFGDCDPVILEIAYTVVETKAFGIQKMINEYIF